MGEVSYLKLKMSDMEGKQGYGAERQHKAEVGRIIDEIWLKILVLNRNRAAEGLCNRYNLAGSNLCAFW